MILGGNLGVLFGAFSFVVGMLLMGNPKKAFKGNLLLVIGMIAAIIGTVMIQLVELNNIPWARLGVLLGLLMIGTLIGKKVSFSFQLTKMPELVSLFNGFGGLAAGLIALVGILQINGNEFSIASLSLLVSSVFLGLFTFSGSLVAFYKLGGRYKWNFKTNQWVNASILILNIGLIFAVLFANSPLIGLMALFLLVVTSLLHGIAFSNGIGGGDMPILISVLNGLTGLLTTVSGIYFGSTVMILSGVFVGATGVILTVQMCAAMNTSLVKVFFGGATVGSQAGANNDYSELIETTAPKVAGDLMLLQKVAIVPGFGLAVAKAQKVCRELKDELAGMGIELKFVIHPVAGRMPGHMNVLLAEAGIEYDDILDLAEGNDYLEEADLCFVIGANDVVNISAENDHESVIYGMPIVQTYKAKRVVVLKRSLSPGYAGIKNPLFENEQTSMLFLDAKSALELIVKNLKLK
ncbi:NAD(P)(+) transhydrogenase (Re/Si-specific) subunit beta [Crocinitomix algicola]|uniref:NAD(P)(+) transhydrogenase (Re/Si-specific) subunit beta n=1 Tax=Crocinitomix algicola TaxID=1740263 RepID=UPI00082F039D|nr:NAD(P)(+) transhydrogenase (Re/Si-specific) subunit beta [Crocinitomix algicola]